MAIIKWEPFGGIDRLFDDRFLQTIAMPKFGWDLAVDLYEEGNNVIAKMIVPGIDPKDIDVSVEEGMLHISGKREEEKEVKNKEYYSKEIHRGAFSRAMSLPKAVDAKNVKAEYKDGVLLVTMPALKEEQKGKVKIEVKK